MPKRKAKSNHLPPANKKCRSDEDILLFLDAPEDEDEDEESDDDNLDPIVVEDTFVPDAPYVQEEDIISEQGVSGCLSRS